MTSEVVISHISLCRIPNCSAHQRRLSRVAISTVNRTGLKSQVLHDVPTDNLAFSEIAFTEYTVITATQGYEQGKVYLQTRVDYQVHKTGQALQDQAEEHKDTQDTSP